MKLNSVRVTVHTDNGGAFGCTEPVSTVEELIEVLVKATATLAAEADERGYR